MTNTITALETEYKDCRFRSRLEARWAVFFDAMGIEWEYEPEGFKLPDGTCYLPDFWLPQVSMYAEVKPVEFSAEEYRKAAFLEALMLVGSPDHKGYYVACEDDPNEDGYRESEVDYWLTSYYLDEHRFFACAGEWGDFDDIKRGVQAARSARFEHGESGANR